VLRISRLKNGQVVFKLSGQMDRDTIAELETIIKLEGDGSPLMLDLNDVTLVGQDGITFLERCEAEGIRLKNCAGYIREWITRQRGGS
jgi:anti-anti-sigma regulatory factor